MASTFSARDESETSFWRHESLSSVTPRVETYSSIVQLNLSAKPRRFSGSSRHVRLTKLSKPSDSVSRRVCVYPKTTFNDVQEDLKHMGYTRAIVLQPHFGPRPYWTESHPDLPIGRTCQELYFIDEHEDTRYALGVVRTSQSDTPVALFLETSGDGESFVSVSQAVLSAAPMLAGFIRSVTNHTGDLRVGDECCEDEIEKLRNVATFPTLFFITTAERPSERFLSEMPNGPIPPIIQTPYTHCRRLIQNTYGLKRFSLQMMHISHALLHVIISLAYSLKTALEASGCATEVVSMNVTARDEGFLDGSKQGMHEDLHQVVPLLIQKLEAILNRINELMERIKTDTVEPQEALSAIEDVFHALCGELPGAVSVRHSYSTFKSFRRMDREETSSDAIMQDVTGITVASPVASDSDICSESGDGDQAPSSTCKKESLQDAEIDMLGTASTTSTFRREFTEIDSPTSVPLSEPPNNGGGDANTLPNVASDGSASEIALYLSPRNAGMREVIRQLLQEPHQEIPDEMCIVFNATPRGPPFTCGVFGGTCMHAESRLDRFKHHLQTHLGIKPYACADSTKIKPGRECDLRFSTIAGRDTHVRNKSPVTCACGTQILPKNMARHRRNCSVYLGLRPEAVQAH